MDDVYKGRVTARAALSPEHSLVHAPALEAGVVVSRLVDDLLSTCTSFRTLEQHVAGFLETRKVAQGQELPLLRSLERLAKVGLLLSKRELLDRTLAAASDLAAPALASIAILTRNRPQGLARSLGSLLQNVRAAGRSATFTIIDSSPDPGVREQNRALLSTFSADSATISAYADLEDKRVFARNLAREVDLAPAIVEFALFDQAGLGNDTGANRNAALLAHAGRPFLSVDDDMVCEPRTFTPRSAGLGIAAANPTVVRLCADLAAARGSTHAADVSVLDCHETLLGKSVAACLREHSSEGLFLDSPTPTLIETMLDGRARVAATFGGLLGDCGAEQPSFHLFDGNSLVPEQADLEDEGLFRTLATSRQIVRAAPRLTIASATFTMGCTFALDTREVCPPFFPAHRGEDLLFGAVLRRCWDDRFFGYLPWTATHLPIEERVWVGEQPWNASPRLPLHSLLLHVLSLVSCATAPSGLPRVLLFGRQLRELAAQPWPELERMIRHRMYRQHELKLAQLDALIRDASPGSAWSSLARRYREACAKQLVETTSLLPPIFDGLSPEAARQGLLRSIASFGRLFECWPALLDAAERLARQGCTLTRSP